jgi:ATP-dependent helicase/nuclease subunit A
MRFLRDRGILRGGEQMTFELNANQSAAADCLDRPVLVTAGAGSGKTRMLTQRFVNAVVPEAVQGWQPAAIDEIVAITFTDKAAGEIAERVRTALRAAGCAEKAREVSDAWISTIHGLCSRILRRYAFEAGIDPLFTIADTVRVGQMRERAFETAARSLLAEQGEGVLLFDAFDVPVMFSATIAIAREAAIAGLWPGDIELEPTEKSGDLLAEAQALFKDGLTTCDLGYVGTSTDPWDHVGRCEELLGRCSVLGSAEHEERELLSELLEALDAYKPVKKLKGLEEMAGDLSARKGDLSGRVAAALTAPYARALKRLVSQYSDEYSAGKASAGMLDFDDLQIRAVRLLEQRPEIARRYRERFRLVMIDEFQDTDALQLRLVEALSEGDLCTVGDEKQSIYRFRGADVGVYRAHRKRMAELGALLTELDINYRSHRDILGFVNAVFGSDEYFGSSLLKLEPPSEERVGELEDALGYGPRVEALFVDSTDVDAASGRATEAACIAARLAGLRDSGVRPGDMAILLRTYTHAHAYAEALSIVHMPATVIGGSRFFGLPEISIMRALNRSIANAEDGVALGNLLASDFVPITSDALAILRMGSGERDRRSLWTLLCEKQSGLAAPDREAAQRLVGVLDRAAGRVGRVPLADVLLLAVEESGWDVRLLVGGNTGRDAFANVLKFARQADAFEASTGTGPSAFAQHLDAKERLGDTEAPASLADDGSDAVRIMSIHASKGLEFPVVVVPGLASRSKNDALSVRTSRREAGLAFAVKTPQSDGGQSRSQSSWFERFSAEDAQAEAEESARVLYVACTRAKEMLLLSGVMGMRPARGTSAKTDLVRLSRILGVAIPVEGPSDAVVPAGESGVPCRVQVVVAKARPRELPDTAPPGREGVLLLPAGQAPTVPPLPSTPDRLSYTQLSEFESCPRRYWVRRVAGLQPASAGRQADADPLQFGTALHAALRLVGSGGEPPVDERLEAIARFFELGADGARRLGLAVGRYCASETARRAIGGDTVRRESPFAMRIGDRFLLTGSIDLYSRTGSEALVVDYKSGEKGERSELEQRYRLQAECYALAVLRDGCVKAAVEFVRPEVDAGGDGEIQRVAFAFAADQQREIEEDLLRRYDEIEASRFEPSPSGACAQCDVLAGMCPERQGDASAS